MPFDAEAMIRSDEDAGTGNHMSTTELMVEG